MSHFGDTLRSLLLLEEMTQEQLAQTSGVDRTLISRMLRDKAPSREQLAQLCAAISSDRSRRMELMFAHLRDEAEAAAKHAGFDERHYVIRAADDAGDDNRLLVPPGLFADFEVLAEECAKHADMRALVEQWAQTILRHRAEVADAQRGKVYPFPGDKGAVAAEPPPHAIAADQLLGNDASRAPRSSESIARTEATSAGSKNRKA